MSFKKGKTPVLAADEARTLLDSIPIVKAVAEDGAAADRPDLVGLRDRALIGLMAYSFARVGAVLQMKVGDYFVQERRRWVRLHEKGGKEHDVPCHHNLDHFLDEYIAAAGIAGDAGGYLFRTTVRKSGAEAARSAAADEIARQKAIQDAEIARQDAEIARLA